MSYTLIKKLPSYETLIQEIPLKDSGYAKINSDRKEIKSILSGKDSRLLMIVGPCSAWPSPAVLDYARKLQRLNTELSDVLKIVMRVYIQKPRTRTGWLGTVNQPDLFSSPDIEAGIRYARKMMIEIISLGLPIADEALFTHNVKGFSELLSWVAIGARSAEDQEHRIFASSLDCAVGMKNPTHGSPAVAVNSVVSAQSRHIAVFDGDQVQTHGNAHAHLVLRGANGSPNYGIDFLSEILSLMKTHQINNPSVIIDASHDNSIFSGQKDYRRQPQVIANTLDAINNQPELKNLIKGFMLESFIQAGSQQIDFEKPESVDLSGLSVTDPCLDWEATEVTLRKLAEGLR